jgi:hypothetical protein
VTRALEVRIEELVLDGFEDVDGEAFGGAVRHEVARLLAGPRPGSRPAPVTGLPATVAASVVSAVQRSVP